MNTTGSDYTSYTTVLVPTKTLTTVIVPTTAPYGNSSVSAVSSATTVPSSLAVVTPSSSPSNNTQVSMADKTVKKGITFTGVAILVGLAVPALLI